MKKSKSYIKKVFLGLCSSALVLSSVSITGFASEQPYSDGIKFNSLGLERVNAARQSANLPLLSTSLSVPFGQEISNGSSDGVQSEILPSIIDNSKLVAFPPIGSQGIGTCGAFATTYYQFTHMYALQNGLNVKDSCDYTKIFSPKLTYNMISGIGGSRPIEALSFMKSQGALPWSDFPYEGYETDPNFTYELPTTSDLWKKSMNYKVDKCGYLELSDETVTPISNENDPDLIPIKKLLTNGYVLTFNFNPNGLVQTGTYTGPINYKCQGSSNSGHIATIVGYDDSKWFDINMNNIKDDGEKGAFKIANSGGTSVDGGYLWIAYDALNSVSSIPDTHDTNRIPAFEDNRVFWCTTKENYTPKLMAEFTLNHSKKSQLSIKLGYSTTNDSNITFVKTDKTFRGDCAFDGSGSTTCDATIDLDLTDFIDIKTLDKNLIWHLIVTDSIGDGVKGKISGFKLIDNVSGEEILPSEQSFPIYVDGSSAQITIPYTRETSETASWSIYKSTLQGRKNSAYTSFNGNLFVIGGRVLGTPSPEFTNQVDILNLQTNTWTNGTLADKLKNPKAFVINNKLYAVGVVYEDGADKVAINEYNSETGIWSRKNATSLMNSLMSCTAAAGKIYFMSESSLIEYKPDLNVFTPKKDYTGPLMASGGNSYGLASANNKVYVFGGYTPANGSVIDLNTLWEYDPSNDSWNERKAGTPFILNGLTPVSIDNKIYFFVSESYSPKSRTGEYDRYMLEFNPAQDSWTKKDYILPGLESSFDVGTIEDKMLFVYRSVLNVSEPKTYVMFDPKGFVSGDVNDDKVFDSADLTIMRRYLLNTISSFPSINGMKAADLNGDSVVDSADYTLMSRKLLSGS